MMYIQKLDEMNDYSAVELDNTTAQWFYLIQ